MYKIETERGDIFDVNMMIAMQITVYGQYKLTDLIFVPPVVSYGKNIVGMVTVDGHLNTTYHRYKES